MKIAVIDDGICLDSALYVKKLEFDLECKDRKVQERKTPAAAGSHGTVVGEIIQSANAGLGMGSIKIIHKPDHKGNIYDLIPALYWCIQNEVDVAHMSLGTTQWHDFAVLEEVIWEIADRICLVAAKSNSGRISLPAALPGVWAVSSAGFSKSGQRLVQKSKGAWEICCDLEIPDSLLQTYGRYIGYSNSYQAAAVTGYFAGGGIFDRDRKVNEKQILKILERRRNLEVLDAFYSDVWFKKRLSLQKDLLTEVPIVWIRISSGILHTDKGKKICEQAYILLKELQKKDYYAVGLSNLLPEYSHSVFWNDKDIICSNDISEILNQYECGLLLICSDKEPLKEADCLLEIQRQTIEYYGKEEKQDRFIFVKREDWANGWYRQAFDFICSYFR
ncbi:MAG: S8 family serine peptidase [Eubacteriales bacterium]|nr:S8 family serine peptidase [Eubacteriales bacterium]